MVLRRDTLIDLLTLLAFMLGVLLFMVRSAEALPRELRWTHPEPERVGWVTVYANSVALTTVSVGAPDFGGVFTTLADVPYGSAVQIDVQTISMSEASPLSNVQYYGTRCSDWDADDSGIIGMTDFGVLKRWGMLREELMLFKGFFGERC